MVVSDGARVGAVEGVTVGGAVGMSVGTWDGGSVGGSVGVGVGGKDGSSVVLPLSLLPL